MSDVLNVLADFFLDNAEGLTCTEVEVLSEAYREAGDADMADLVVRNHAFGDDEGDSHYIHEGEEEEQ